MDNVLLIDGHNAFHRANVSFGPPVKHEQCMDAYCIHLKDGVSLIASHCICKSPWNMAEHFCYGQKYLTVYNFFRNLRPIIEDFTPDKCFLVLEGHPQFRYDLFPDYKANRLIKRAAKQDDSNKFLESAGHIVRLLQYFPITIARAVNYEADDLVSTLAEDMKEEDLIVLSNDSDYIQLLQKGYKNLIIYNPIKKVAMEAPNYPYMAGKCLMGDKSDNIPGLLKPKKALATINDPELFKQFMSVEENRANFNINRQLIEFRMVPPEEIILKEGARNFEKLKQEFADMKFESIINDKSWEKYTSTFDCLRY